MNQKQKFTLYIRLSLFKTRINPLKNSAAIIFTIVTHVARIASMFLDKNYDYRDKFRTLACPIISRNKTQGN